MQNIQSSLYGKRFYKTKKNPKQKKSWSVFYSSKLGHISEAMHTIMHATLCHLSDFQQPLHEAIPSTLTPRNVVRILCVQS